jgi:hypothetical protein
MTKNYEKISAFRKISQKCHAMTAVAEPDVRFNPQASVRVYPMPPPASRA